MSYPHLIYTEGLDYGNILWAESREDMEEIFRNIAGKKVDLEALREGSRRCAQELLDYRVLAARLYH